MTSQASNLSPISPAMPASYVGRRTGTFVLFLLLVLATHASADRGSNSEAFLPRRRANAAKATSRGGATPSADLVANRNIITGQTNNGNHATRNKNDKNHHHHYDFDASISTTSDFALYHVRGGGGNMVVDAAKGLKDYMNQGLRSDALTLLGTTAINTPLCTQVLKLSPILGFLILGILLGPQGMNVIKDLHTTELMADFGVVLFLFEMGIHLSFNTLMQMKQVVFGLGGMQWGLTALFVFALCKAIFKLSTAASVIIGGALALSSSAFVLQLLKDKNEMESTYGKTSFAILLLQDLMVVPILVIIPILAGGGADTSVGAAVASAVVSMIMALTIILGIGNTVLVPLYDFVASAKSQEAFVGLILCTIFGMSFLTEGLGLSNTLGAFLSGVLLADTKHKHDIEREIAPFRAILVGIFFFSVGFEIDLKLIMNKFPLIACIVAGLLSLKAALATFACMKFNLPLPTARRIGMVLSQGGEFAFVAFRMARSKGVLSNDLCKLLLTCVSLTMAATPFLEETGTRLEKEALASVQAPTLLESNATDTTAADADAPPPPPPAEANKKGRFNKKKQN